MATRLAIAILIILLFLQNFDHSEGWRRRRRRRRCSPSNCAVSGWSIWSGCSHSCGSHGTRYRTRSVTRGASCGGSCPYGLRETVSCNRVCCPVNCVHSWGVWGACQGCGNNGQQTRSLVITQNSSCGGTGCPTTRSQTRSCLPPRTNVCSYRLSYSHRYTVQVTYGAYTSYRTCCSHFLWCWKKCTRYRWVRRYRYEVRYTTRYNTYYRCCQGWRQGACLSSCLSPICNSPGCAHGNCIRPNTCLCHSGWTSPSQGCNVDINECANSNGGCQQLCTNLPGTHRCGCNRGYTLIGSTRCQDVNECATSHRLCSCDDQPNNPSCIASCSNTLGSYRCTCSAGYQLLHHGRCIDVNECMANNGQCSHTCTNYPGTHRCSCHSGYQLNSDARSCSDVNECSTNNGGCDHSCINTPGSFTCQCRSGYTLDPNGRTCSDIDECGLHYHGCQHNCNNFRGGFYCSCRSGYRLNNDNRTCSDINECTEYHLSRGGLNSTISGCTQNCHNVIGTFRCSCNPGYKLASDGKTCYDVDECLEGSHRCHQKCLNTVGSYDCQCLQGYKENADGYSCQAVSCIRHPPVVNGRGTCFFGQANETCQFRCLPGFQLRGSPERRCQANHTWSGFMPICTRKNCKPISPPPNGGIQLPCLNYYQAICTLQCSQGFYPTGSTQLMCRATANNTMYWLNKATECKEITICAPNPCKHGGICNAIGLKKYQCNCQRTGYQGPNCNRGIVTLPLFPIMYVNRNYSFTVKAKLDIELRILLAPYDENLSIYPKKLVFNQAKNSANFTVRATIAGPYVLSYKLYGDNAGVFDAPMNSIVFFRETNKSMAVNIINDEGILSKGCHSQSSVEKRTDGTRKAGLTLYSTAPWQHRPNSESTDGMVLIDVEGTSGLPTSLVGSTITIESLTNNNFDEFVNKYRRIRNVNESVESRIPQCISVIPSNEYLAEAIELNSFAKTVAEGVNRRTPSLLNIFVEKSAKIFDLKDLVANIYSGNEVKRIFTKCSKVLLGIDENKKYFVFLTTQRVLLHIAEEEIDLKRDDVVCIFESINGNETLIGFPDSASESAVWESLTGFAGIMKGIHISAEDKKQIYRVFGEYSAVLSTNTFKMAFKLNGDMLMDTDEAFEFFVDGVKSIKSMSANGKIDLHVDDNFMGDIERTTFSSNGSVTFNSTDEIMGKQKVVLELENVSGRSSRYVMAGRVKLDKNVQMKYIIWAKVSGGLILGAVNLTNSDNIRSEMHSLNASIGLSLQGAITAYPGLHRIINDVLRDLYLAVSSSESLSRYCHETRGKEALKSLTKLKRQLERVDRRLQVLVLKHSNMVDFLASKRIFEKVFTTFHVSVDKMEQWFKKLFNRTRVSRSIEACSLYSKGTLCLAHLCFKNCHIEILYQIPSKTMAERFNLAPDYENVTAVIGKLETDAMLGNHLKIPKGNHIVILINNTKTYSGFFNGSMEIFGRSTNVSIIFNDNKLEFSTKATLPDGSLTTVQVVADIKNVISGDEVVFNIKGFVANNSIIIEDINKVLHSKIHMVAQDVSERLEILEKAVNTSRKHKSKADLNVKRLEELFKKKAERANQVESALNRTNSQYQNIKLALNARLKHYDNAVENYTKTIEQCAPKVCLKKCVPGLVTNICYEERYEHVTTQSCMLLSKHLTRTEMQEVSTEKSYVNYFPKYNCWTRCPPLTGFFKKVFGKRKRRGIISFLAKKALEKVLKTGGEKVFEYLGGKEGAMGAKIGAMLPGPWGIVGMLVGGVIGSAFGSCEKLCKTTMVPRENFYIHYESVKVTKVIDYKERQCDDVVIRQKLGYKDGFECSSYSNCSKNLVDVECVQRNYHCRSLRGVLKEKIKHILGAGDMFEDYERLSLLIENLEMQQRMAIKERRNVHQSFLAAKAIALNSNYTYLLSMKSLANLNHILATEMHILELTKRLGSHPVSVQNGHYKFVTSKGTVATNMIALQMDVVRKDGPNSLAIALIDFKRMNVSISETVNEIIKLIPNLKARRRRSVGSDAEVSVSVDEMFRNATKTKCKLMERNILYLFEIANMFTVGVHQFEKSNLSIHNAELSEQNFTRSTQDILANTSVCHDKNSSSCSSDWLASLYSNTTQDSNGLGGFNNTWASPDQLTTTALPVTTTALPVTTTALPVTTTSQDATKVPVESQTFSDMPKKDSTTYTTVAFKGTKSAVESLEKGMDKKTILLIVGFTIAGIILFAVVIIIIIAMRRRVSNQIKADMQMKTWYIDDEIEDNTPDTHDEIHIGYSFGNPMYDSQVKSAVIMENERCGVEKTLSEC
ncbi:uncharacterized protein LOC135690976 [Rhopilema esculentum]|uniref:uncharacterized protein LOC135690976 n=1 Tax=Rhopilema esculentum TaxID=499914 RepID=UPI0031D3967E